MRKYRNIKGNSQPKRILKYSEEWIQYRKSRGSDSVKTEHCDIDTDGHLDAIVRAWRSPALKKVQICEPAPPAVPSTGPTALAFQVVTPSTGPTGLTCQVAIPSTGPTGLNSQVVSVPSTGPTALTSQVALPPIATKVYIRPEVRALPFTASRTAAGTDLGSVYTNFNFSPGATTGTACNTYGTTCYSVYNQKNAFATNTPGTFHLGGLYKLSTPVTSLNPFYTRTHKLDLINNVYIADTDNSKPILTLRNNTHTGFLNRWQLRWDGKEEAKFNFGGMFDWTVLPSFDEQWLGEGNLSTGIANTGDTDLTNLVGLHFVPYSLTTGFNGTYRLTSALKT